MRVRTSDVGLRLRAVPDAKILHQPHPDGSVIAHGKGCEHNFYITALRGSLHLENQWQLREGRNRGINFSEGIIDLAPNSELLFRECDGGPQASDNAPFDQLSAEINAHWADWLAAMPQTNLPDWEHGRALAAYIDWSSVVSPRGLYQHPVMVMNKTHMDQVWSWDHCFNAMACAQGKPDIAWAQFMAIADHQDAYGCLPDSVNQRSVSPVFTKPPIHGWAYARCWDQNPAYFGDQNRLEITYAWMSAWSRWWLDHATWGMSKLPFYIHGNNSGWDNATIFDIGTPTISPDCAAYLAYQCEVLGRMANELGKANEAKQWTSISQDIIAELIEKLWRDNRFVGQLAASGEDIDCASLITCMPIILGKRLPDAIHAALAQRIKATSPNLAWPANIQIAPNSINTNTPIGVPACGRHRL